MHLTFKLIKISKSLEIEYKIKITLVINEKETYKSNSLFSSTKYKNRYVLVKGYRFLSLAKNMNKNIGKNISKNLSSKYSPSMLAARQKLLDPSSNLLQMHLKLFQKEELKKQQKQLVIWLTIKLLIKLQKFSRILQQNTLESVIKEAENFEDLTFEIPKEWYIPPQIKTKIIYDLKLI